MCATLCVVMNVSCNVCSYTNARVMCYNEWWYNTFSVVPYSFHYAVLNSFEHLAGSSSKAESHSLLI